MCKVSFKSSVSKIIIVIIIIIIIIIITNSYRYVGLEICVIRQAGFVRFSWNLLLDTATKSTPNLISYQVARTGMARMEQ